MSGGPFGALAACREGLRLDRLEEYARELERWNRAVRLVGPRDLPGIRVQIADALWPFLLHPPRFPLLDVGSGAGLPALPVAVAFPGAPIACLEPQGKRVSFLRHAVRALGLEGVRVVQGRAEEAADRDPSLREAFATVTARAVGSAGELLALAAPYLAPGGTVFLPRGDEEPAHAGGWDLLLDEPYAGPEGVGIRRLQLYARAARPPAGR